MDQFEGRVAWVASCIDSTEAKDSVDKDRIIQVVERKYADSVAILRTQLSESGGNLSNSYPTLVRSPISAGVRCVNIDWLILVECW